MKSEICSILGIKYPIIQGGMAWISDASLASAVSNAGGLGVISSINYGVDAVRDEIRKCKSLTDKPFGVNIMLQGPLADAIAQMVIDEQVPVVTTGAGLPSKYIDQWLKAGIKVLTVVASPALAQRAERMGATAIIAEGGESGGHIGEMNTFALVPMVVDAVNIPVIAAGGIADGRGFAAAIMLGASACQCGTRFLSADECTVCDVYKDKILAAKGTDTVVTGKKLGHPVRALRTPFTTNFAKMENDPEVTSEQIMEYGTGSLRKAVKDGDLAMGSYMAGQVVGLVNKRESAADIVEDIVNGAAAIFKKRGVEFFDC